MKRELKRNGSKKYSTTKRSIAEPIPMKRELKLNVCYVFDGFHINCRAYPDEKGIETILVT